MDNTKNTPSIIKTEQQGLFYLHIAIFLFGGTAIFAKLIALPALDITVYRTGIAAITLLIFLTLQKQKLLLTDIYDYGIAVLLGAIVGFHWVTYFAGMQMAGVTIGVIAFFTYPIMTVFIEPFFSQNRIKHRDIILVIIVIIGIVMLIPEISFGNEVTLGIATGILSAMFFSLRNILHKHYFSQYSGPHTMLYQTLVAFIILCLFVDVPPAQVSGRDWFLLLMVGVIFTAIPHALFASSLRYLSATTVGLISCLQPLYGGILAIVLLNERPNLFTIIGGLLVISAAAFETYSISKKNDNNFGIDRPSCH